MLLTSLTQPIPLFLVGFVNQIRMGMFALLSNKPQGAAVEGGIGFLHTPKIFTLVWPGLSMRDFLQFKVSVSLWRYPYVVA